MEEVRAGGRLGSHEVRSEGLAGFTVKGQKALTRKELEMDLKKMLKDLTEKRYREDVPEEIRRLGEKAGAPTPIGYIPAAQEYRERTNPPKDKKS